MCNPSHFRHHLHLQNLQRHTWQKPGSLITAAQSGHFLLLPQHLQHDNMNDDARVRFHLWLQQHHFRTELTVHTWLSMPAAHRSPCQSPKCNLGINKWAKCMCRAEAFWTFLDCITPLCMLMYAWGLDESPACVCLSKRWFLCIFCMFVYVYLCKASACSHGC